MHSICAKKLRLLGLMKVLAIGVFVGLFPGMARADHVVLNAQQQGHGDTMGYLLFLFLSVLGIIVACRSARRTSEVRLDSLEDD